MTNYTKTTDFTAKDSLPTGDTQKIVRGSDFDTEFDNIATAITSKANQSSLDAKADKASPTFTGTVTLPSDTSIGLVSADEILYLNGVTSAIQTQIDSKTSLTSFSVAAEPTASGDGSLAYNNTTGVFTYTPPDLSGLGGGSSVITDLTANNNKVFYSNGTGNVTELALGASGTVLTSNGATAAPTWDAPSGYTLNANLVDLETPESLGTLTSATLVSNDAFIVYDASGSTGDYYKKVQLQAIGPTTEASATQSLVASDGGKLFYNNTTSNHTYTVPSGLAAGTEFAFANLSTGKITLAASGVTIKSLDGHLNVKGSGGGAYLVYITSTLCFLAGDLEA